MRILWATEGSASSTRVGGIIPHLRGGPDADVLTLAVIPGDPLPWLDLVEEQTAQQQLERLRREALHEVLDAALIKHGLAHGAATVEVVVGDPARTIAEVAESQHADLILVAPRHRAIATEIIGPTTQELIVRAPCPVLIPRETDPWRAALLATDGSAEAGPAEAALAALAPPETRITALTVVPPPPSNEPVSEAAERPRASRPPRRSACAIPERRWTSRCAAAARPPPSWRRRGSWQRT